MKKLLSYVDVKNSNCINKLAKIADLEYRSFRHTRQLLYMARDLCCHAANDIILTILHDFIADGDNKDV